MYKQTESHANNTLKHHGIKGQKWGVRRFQNPDGSYTRKGKARYSKTKTDLSKYSTDELNKMNNRMQAEIDYKTKYAKLHPKDNLGEAFVNETLNKLAKVTLPALVSSAVTAVGMRYINKKLGNKQK